MTTTAWTSEPLPPVSAASAAVPTASQGSRAPRARAGKLEYVVRAKSKAEWQSNDTQSTGLCMACRWFCRVRSPSPPFDINKRVTKPSKPCNATIQTIRFAHRFARRIDPFPRYSSFTTAPSALRPPTLASTTQTTPARDPPHALDRGALGASSSASTRQDFTAQAAKGSGGRKSLVEGLKPRALTSSPRAGAVGEATGGRGTGGYWVYTTYCARE